MKVHELLDAFENVDADNEVVIFSAGHRSAFLYKVSGLEEVDTEGKTLMVLEEGAQIGYAPSEVRDAF